MSELRLMTGGFPQLPPRPVERVRRVQQSRGPTPKQLCAPRSAQAVRPGGPRIVRSLLDIASLTNSSMARPEGAVNPGGNGYGASQNKFWAIVPLDMAPA